MPPNQQIQKISLFRNYPSHVYRKTFYQSSGVSEFIERHVGQFTIRIDRHLCVGFGDCIDVADRIFYLDDEGIVAFHDPFDPDEERALEACRVCPVDALTAYDASGRQVAP